eukprot:UN05306
MARGSEFTTVKGFETEEEECDALNKMETPSDRAIEMDLKRIIGTDNMREVVDKYLHCDVKGLENNR